MLCLGCDPDMHDLAIASWDDQGPVAAHVVSVKKSLKGTDALLAMMHELSKPWPAFDRLGGLIELSTTEHGVEGFIDFPSWAAVEGQDLKRGGNNWHKRPQDIVHLGNVAGMAVMRARGYLHGGGIYWPKPSEWKGSLPKAVMQARLYEELGWGYVARAGYSVPHQPPESFEFGATWKHVGDALLLAKWCWEQATKKPWKRVLF